MVRHHSSRMGRRSVVVASIALGVAISGCGSSGRGPGEDIGTTSSAYTFPNDQPAFDYFRSKGLTAVQAAGIVGNLDQESGDDPTSVQYGGGPGRGIAQWSVGGRWDTDTNDNATWYAQKENEELLSLQLQLEFVWYELTTFQSYGLASLQQATSVSAATIAFETDFEGCGECDQSTRIMYAENVLAAFGSDSVDASAPPPDAGDGVGTPCTVTTTGDMGVCMLTSACAALGQHVSTPGYCPGPDDVECCTSTKPAGEPDAGAPDRHDAGSSSSGSADAGTTHGTGPADASGHPEVIDAEAPGDHGGAPGSGSGSRSAAGGPVDGGAEGEPLASNGGCATAGSRGRAGDAGSLAIVLVFGAIDRRRRRRATRLA
jgi:hypothetical protein